MREPIVLAAPTGLPTCGGLFPSRSRARHHLATAQYDRLTPIGLDPVGSGTRSLRRTNVGPSDQAHNEALGTISTDAG